MSGKLIVLEGLDGSGTTTQSHRLVNRILGLKMSVARSYEPSGPLEKSVREAIHDQDNRWPLLWLFAASRAHNNIKMAPLLDRGAHVVCDRYVMSSLAYQALDHDMSYIWTVNEKFRQADLTIYLDTPVPVCISRLASRAERDPFETQTILTAVEENYRRAISLYEHVYGQKVVVIDGALTEDEIEEQIWKAVLPILELG